MDQRIEELIGSLIQQLLLGQPTIPKDVHDLYASHHRSNTQPDLSELSKLLHSSVEAFSNVYIIVDALDECDEGGKRRSQLLSYLLSLDSRVRLFFTSRPLGDVEDLLPSAVRFKIRAQDPDMHKYITAQIDREPNLARLCKKNEDLRDEISQKIIAKADGM
jgi:hypothetical protein